MKVRAISPTHTRDINDVEYIDVDGATGRFALLPRHADCVVALGTGLVEIRVAEDEERYIGIDGGVLVKVEDQVTLSSPRIVMDEPLGRLRETLMERRRQAQDNRRDARQALTNLEVELARSIFDAEEKS